MPNASAVSMKIVILMTDGENSWYQSDYTSYGRPGEMIRASDINPSMERLCTAIKANGVLLFTITFGTGVNLNIRNLYSRCASSTLGDTRVAGPKYFHAPTGAQLATIFGDIAGQVSDLRLVR